MCMLVIIIVAPEIIVPPNNAAVINGSEAVFNCTVVGDPLPSISWSFSGVNLASLFSNDIMIPFDEDGNINDIVVNTIMLNGTTIYSSLTLMETASFIAGNYTCEAYNSFGNINRTVNSTATLTVYGK